MQFDKFMKQLSTTGHEKEEKIPHYFNYNQNKLEF